MPVCLLIRRGNGDANSLFEMLFDKFEVETKKTTSSSLSVCRIVL